MGNALTGTSTTDDAALQFVLKMARRNALKLVRGLPGTTGQSFELPGGR